MKTKITAADRNSFRLNFEPTVRQQMSENTDWLLGVSDKLDLDTEREDHRRKIYGRKRTRAI